MWIHNPGYVLSHIWLLLHLYTGNVVPRHSDATPAQCIRPNPDTAKPLSANVTGLYGG